MQAFEKKLVHVRNGGQVFRSLFINVLLDGKLLYTVINALMTFADPLPVTRIISFDGGFKHDQEVVMGMNGTAAAVGAYMRTCPKKVAAYDFLLKELRVLVNLHVEAVVFQLHA